jgi:hypothetical protein
MPAKRKAKQENTYHSDSDEGGSSEDDPAPAPQSISSAAKKKEVETTKASQPQGSASTESVNITNVGGLNGLANIISVLTKAGAQLRGKVDDSGRYELIFDLDHRPRMVSFKEQSPPRTAIPSHRRNSKEFGSVRKLLSG